MTLTRLLTTAAAAALIACPALALAQSPAAAPDTAAPAAAPPPAPPAAPALPSIPKIAPGADIYETVKASGQFTILVKALDAAGLTKYLKQYPSLTLFAPTDAAFQALPPDQLAKLTAPGDASANLMQQVLKYHLVNTSLDSSGIKGHKGPVPTLEGSAVVIDGSNDVLLVNNADILQPDVRSANGAILHAIDKVLIPADSPLAPQSAAATPASTVATPASGTAAMAPAS
ncbi:MAG: fasciclin domain-containing protein [Caulobacterales bacterium]